MPPFSITGTRENIIIQDIDALQGGARTWLVHNFGNGLDGEDGFVVERFKALFGGDIRPVWPEAPKTGSRRKAKRTMVSREEVEALRPARTEIIVCTGLRTRSGRQISADIVTGIFPRLPPEGLKGVHTASSAGARTALGSPFHHRRPPPPGLPYGVWRWWRRFAI